MDERTLSPLSLSLPQAMARALGRDALEEAEAALAAQAASDLDGDLDGADAGVLGALLAEVWRATERRTAGTPAAGLGPAAAGDAALPFDLLYIVQDDSPFLVDSVMGELTAQGLEIAAMAHPVVEVVRGPDGRRGGEGARRRESVILAFVSPQGADRRAAVLQAVEAVLADVHAAVDDFPAMLALMGEAVGTLAAAPVPPQAIGLDEQLAFLRWLSADRFVFLGARVYAYPRDAAGDYLREEPVFDPDRSLGVLRDRSRSVLRPASEPAILSPDPRRYLAEAPAVVVAKSNLRSRVHRRVHMDYVGVRRYGADGQPVGEIRFVGLFTIEAYEEPARSLPLVRRKIERVLARAGASPSSHNERRLRHIVETYPRDDLFQVDEETLLTTALGILHLYDRPRVRLFARKDPFDRFVSVLLYVPRERHHADTPGRAATILARAWGGRVSAVYPRSGDEPLARIHVIVGLDPGHHPEPDLAALERQVSEALRTWEDRFEQRVHETVPEGEAGRVVGAWRDAFPAGYRDRYSADEAIADLAEVEALEASGAAPIRVRSFRRDGDAAGRFRFKLYVRPGPAPLSDVLPIVEQMGLRALDEAGFPLSPAGRPEPAWVHDYLVEGDAAGPGFDAVAPAFEAAVAAVWTGAAECDGFNRLVLDLGVGWRKAALIRTLARWRQQSGLDPGQAVQVQAMAEHPDIVRLILDLFRAKFDPAVERSPEDRRAEAEAVFARIEQALQDVASLDDDRVLRRIAEAVKAATRTNFHQAGADGAPKPYIAIKFASGEVQALPAPKPFREIFVASPQVEAVHTRFGPVARGGLRWSDRRDDFRTEVLGLVRTQQVKNAVIVPVGAKGGFYPKKLPRGAGPDAVRAEAIAAYRTFLAGLLDLTDNLASDGTVIHPAGVVRHDEDDPYLVVAADKGTASFSDIANAMAEDYGYWLGDAFASGGSAGYDHKGMGITARGAWEAVKRHFRELGKDIQSEPFTCVGVGDMSGDVFGNGMLLSKATRLVAAFDHRHVFIDPDPDPERSWAERKRLFDLPRSSWGDYDPALISKGGGVFPRTAKSIELSPEARAALGVEAERLDPLGLVRAVLAAPVELLYLGGIGTYVKAPGESHAEVSDKTNDAVRLDATELRCRVVGEGANLGFTQAGRIAYARAGGRIDTDAIDNSAGVDTSDHEVNIKILLGQAERAGTLDRAGRDRLLQEMTEDVAAHVLAHNYDQTLALSLGEAEAVGELGAHIRFMAELTAAGRLDRRVEGLPEPAALAELKAQGKGLTRPELAVLLAYGKLELSAALTAGSGPDDPWFERALKAYFPAPLARFEPEMTRHRLRREIISTVIANTLVDRLGPTFATRVRASLGCDAATVAAAFAAAQEIFAAEPLWRQVCTLDLKVDARLQLELFAAIAAHLRAQTYWLARRCADEGVCPPPVQALVERHRAGVEALQKAGLDSLSAFDRARAEARRQRLEEAGAPTDIAAAVAGLEAQRLAVEVVDLGAEAGLEPLDAARVFHGTGAALGLDRLRAAAAEVRPADDFERRALRQLIIQLVLLQGRAARAVLAARPGAAPQAAIEAWSAPRAAGLARARRIVEDVEQAAEGWSFAKLALAQAALAEAAA